MRTPPTLLKSVVQFLWLRLAALHCNPSKSLRFAKIFATDGTDGTDFF